MDQSQRDGAGFRVMVAGLVEMGPVRLRGQEYTGAYLASLVAVDAERSEAELGRTPQLVSELGRLTAAAYRDHQMVQAEYRVWRDGLAWRCGNDLDYALAQGFDAAKPSSTAKGEPRPGKCPGKDDIDAWLRTRPEYADWWRRQYDAEETWQSLHAAFEAAKLRAWVARGFERSGGADTTPRGDGGGPVDRYDERADLHTQEERATQGARSPLPPLPTVGGPPGATQPAAPKPPPPPPSRG